MDGQTRIKLSLGIGLEGEQEEFRDLEELLPNWADLNEEELEEKLHLVWRSWIWEHIDGCAEIIEDEDKSS